MTHNMPALEEKTRMQARNALCGHRQPNGQFDLAKFAENGSYGIHLMPHIEKLQDPLTEDDTMRNWLLVKTVAVNAENHQEENVKKKKRTKKR